MEVKNYFDKKPDVLISKLYESLHEIDGTLVDGPSNTFGELEKLVLKVAVTIRRDTTQKIFMYEGIRRLAEGFHYIIHFGCSGMGVQRKDQKRLDQFQINMSYNKNEGTIKVIGQDVGDSLPQHRWIIDTPEFLEYFMPSQPAEEIANAILTCINLY